MAHVYEKRKDPDGFLYITYTDETTLGWTANSNRRHHWNDIKCLYPKEYSKQITISSYNNLS
jgi:hypothetical protein